MVVRPPGAFDCATLVPIQLGLMYNLLKAYYNNLVINNVYFESNLHAYVAEVTALFLHTCCHVVAAIENRQDPE